MTENKKAGRWQPGKSGNPKGKPPGTGELQKLRTAIGEHVPAIIEQLATAAIAGDVQARANDKRQPNGNQSDVEAKKRASQRLTL